MVLFSNYKTEYRAFVNSAEIVKSLRKQNFSEIFTLYYTLIARWVTRRQEQQQQQENNFKATKSHFKSNSGYCSCNSL